MKSYIKSRLIFAIVTAIALTAAVLAVQPARAALPASPVAQIFLPFVRQPAPVISGQVTLNGTPVEGVSLELRFYNGANYSTLTTTSTGADGNYEFAGVPSLAPGQSYYVRFRNYPNTPGRLWVWGAKPLTAYTAGSSAAGGNFDIADIALASPSDTASIGLPFRFTWTPRPATPTDSYELDLYDPGDSDPYIYTNPLGYVDGFDVTGLPGDFEGGAEYVWEVWVYSPDGGYGISFESRRVKFNNIVLNSPALSPSQHSQANAWRADLAR
jgi:hypothetical protein